MERTRRLWFGAFLAGHLVHRFMKVLYEVVTRVEPGWVGTTAAAKLTEHQGDPNTSTDNVTYYYDAWNRVVEVRDDQDAPIVKYAYDALGRRIVREVPDGAGGFDVDYFYYDGNRVIESGKLFDDKGTFVYQTHRQYVYGLDYIDEHVAQYHAQPGTLHFTLTDANYNVIALTDSSGSLVEQYRYEPYGTVYAADNTGGPIDLSNGLDVLVNLALHQGLFYDPIAKGYPNRVRFYDPILIRYLQSDPNLTALLVSYALARNAQSQQAFLSLTAGGQYADGMSPYQYLGSNPLNRRDPSGRDDEYDDLIAERTGLKLSALSDIQTGARWAAIGSKTAASIAGSLLGFDFIGSFGDILGGDATLEDYLTLGLSAIPVAGGALRAAWKALKWIKKTRTARRGEKFVGIGKGNSKYAAWFDNGSFSIINWSRYPKGSVPRPTGPFRLLRGAEYNNARTVANRTNASLRKANPEKYAGKQIHEITPVKFGGSPTDSANKIALTQQEHTKYTNWWNALQQSLEKGP